MSGPTSRSNSVTARNTSESSKELPKKLGQKMLYR